MNKKSRTPRESLEVVPEHAKRRRVGKRVDSATRSLGSRSPYFTNKSEPAVEGVCSDATASAVRLTDDATVSLSAGSNSSEGSDSAEGTAKEESSSKSPLPSSPSSPSILPASSKRLDRSFFDHPGENLARSLLGKVLVRRLSGGMRVSGRIVETEAYLGKMDKAAHSFKKKTDRNAAMFMDPGTAYVYNIYGMYCCMNISSQGEGCAVLLRAIEPLEGIDEMTRARQPQNPKSAAKPKPLKEENLCNGPSKLCQALSITKNAINAQDMTSSPDLWLEEGSWVDGESVVVTKRVNIGYAEDWVEKPLRFYVLDNKFVSKPRDKEAEKLLREKS